MKPTTIVQAAKIHGLRIRRIMKSPEVVPCDFWQLCAYHSIAHDSKPRDRLATIGSPRRVT